MKQMFSLTLVALCLMLAGACTRYEVNPNGKSITLARDFISTQPVLLERVGEIKGVNDVSLEQQGQSGTVFGWFYREQEEWVLRVVGSKETVFTRVTLARRGSNPQWEVINWGVLSNSEASQYMVPAGKSPAAPAEVTPPGVIGY